MSISNIDKIREKVEKLKKLADKMYYAAQYLTTDASRLHKAMDEYHQFLIYEYYKEEHEYLEEEIKFCAFSTSRYTDKERKALCEGCEEECKFNKKEEPASEDLEEEIGKYCSNPENFITYIDVGFMQSPIKKDDIPLIIKAIKFGANWQLNQIRKENEKNRD